MVYFMVFDGYLKLMEKFAQFQLTGTTMGGLAPQAWVYSLNDGN